MWGQVKAEQEKEVSQGIIPTRVGTSKSSVQHFRCPWDHPHACGDKNVVILEHTERRGSSPRVWGQVLTVLALSVKSGIIPTRVGTSTFFGLVSQPVQDHPHACGDKRAKCLSEI